MRRTRKKKCCQCKELFHADARNRRHQRYCSKPDCQRASKQVSQRRWLNQSENRDYFRGPEQVERVRNWRRANPGYWRRKKSCTLQDVLIEQGVEKTKESGSYLGGTLQDVLTVQPLVILGLIAKLSGSTLQDDIAFTTRQLLRLGQDIVGGKDDAKTTYLPRTSATGTQAIQLGGSATGA